MKSLMSASNKQDGVHKLYSFSAMICIALCLACAAASAGGNQVRNSGFEEVENGRFEDWESTGESDQVTPKAVTGIWQRATCKVDGREGGDSVTFHLYTNKGSTGSIWIDNVTVSPARSLKNPSFEEKSKAGGVVGWAGGGTVFSDARRRSHGRRSLRITSDERSLPLNPWFTAQIYQEIPLEAGKEYSVSFDYMVGDDFVGTARGYIMDATGSVTRQTNFQDTEIRGARDECERYVCVLSPRQEEPVELRQRVDVMPDMNLEASVEANNPKLDGSVTLIVEDAASKEVLGQAALSEGKEKWLTLRTRFQSRSSEVVLRVVARGQGEVEVDNVAITPPQPIPPLQEVEWLPVSEDFTLPSALRVSIEGDSGAVLEQGLAMLADDLAALSDVTVETVEPGDAPFTIAIGPEYALADNGDESYSLEIDEQGIRIQAGTEAGAFYGLMTVLQLLREGEAAPVALACDVTDYPDMPLRGVLYGDPEQAARWKMNTLTLSTGYPVSRDERDKLHEAVAKYQRLNLEVIPYFHSIEGGYYVQQQNPNLATGIWVKGEKMTLKGVEPSPLANPFVIRTELTDVALASADGKRRYRIGKDYDVVDGDMAWPYTQENPKPFAVVRTAGSSIPSGATVLASYDHVSLWRGPRYDIHIPYCPLEPEVRRLMGEYMKNLARDFPFRYINTTHDLQEFGPSAAQLATDSRVIASGKSPIELLAEDVRFLDKSAKAGRADVRLLDTVGVVNDDSRQAGPKLPRDTHIEIWGHEAAWPVIYGRASVAYWSKLGFETSAQPWYDRRNVRAWAQVIAEARAKGYPCKGVMVACWPDVQAGEDARERNLRGMEEGAIVSWKIPQEGDRRFIQLPPLEPEEN